MLNTRNLKDIIMAFKLDLNNLNLPTTIADVLEKRAKELKGKEAPKDLFMAEGEGMGFYDNLFRNTPRLYKPVPNKTDYFTFLPAVFPFTEEMAAEMQAGGMPVAELTAKQRAILSDPESYHSLVQSNEQPSLSYFQSPLMIMVTYGMERASRTEGNSTKFGLTRPIISNSTTALYPGLWENLESPIRPFRQYRNEFQRLIGNDEFWDRMREKDLPERKQECLVITSTLYVAGWVLPLRKPKDDAKWQPELLWLKLPSGANAFSRGGTKPKAYPLWKALTKNRQLCKFPILWNSRDPVVFSWTMTQPKGKDAQAARMGTSYDGGEFLSLSDPEVQEHLRKEGMTGTTFKEVIAEECLPYIAQNPLSATLKVASVGEELDLLNEYLAVKGEEASVIEGTNKLSFQAKIGVRREVPPPSQEMPKSGSQTPSPPLTQALSLKKIEEESAGLLLMMLLGSDLAQEGGEDSVIEVVIAGIKAVVPDIQWEDLTKIIEEGMPNQLDRKYPDVAATIKATLSALAEDRGGSIPL